MSNVKESAYYPLKKGAYAIYEVKKISYNDLGTNDTVQYFLKELVKETIINLTNDTTYLLERYKKDKLELKWEIDSVWSVRKDQNRIIKQEQNIPFIKIVFPEKEGISWNGNALNSLLANEYVIQDFEKPFVINNVKFTNALTVQQSNKNSIVNSDIRKEVYAKDIGLIYKYSFVVNYVNDPSDPRYNTNYAISGFFLEEKFVEMGFE
ncbi:MAG: hypothetical protein OHK0038_12330 [Flammeovirgaceae bacterium]